jgi:hypothetical protein
MPVIDSSNYFKSPSYIFTFAAKIIRTVGGGYPRLLGIQKGTITDGGNDLVLNCSGSTTVTWSIDQNSGFVIGTTPYTLGTTSYLIFSINSATKTCTLSTSPNRDGSGATNLTFTSNDTIFNNIIGTDSAVNHIGKWWVGADPRYPLGQNSSSWNGSIQEILISTNVMTYAQCFP